ncbi:MAG: isoprenylcysteine carboxylmethyltransferase family protein [Deltaproteobacteria bacterium]|nr:isoprenylcysteine carboxylmethyltransferase family protein [Deltaproteobacteria bacterium]
MPLAALVGYVVFLVLAFGLRAVIHRRRTGSTGWVGLTGRPLSLEWLAGVLFGVAVLGSGLAPLAQLAGLTPAWGAVDRRLVHVLGLACSTVGIAGTLWAQVAMGASWRIGVDPAARTELVSEGPFRFVRHPIFTWMTFASAGLVLLAPNALALAAFAALVVALELQVRWVEEPYLLRVHGDRYRRYAATTGRFLPCIGRSIRRARSGSPVGPHSPSVST